MAQELETQEDRFKGLTNQELILIFYRLENYLDTLNKNLDKNVVTKQIETSMGIATAMKNVKPEHVAKFKETLYYNTLVDVVKKLKPITEIIESCDETVIKTLEQLK